jgi:predicted GNAT family acetyltransferase
MTNLRVERSHDATAFAARVRPFLQREAAVYNLELGLLRLLEGDAEEAADTFFAMVLDGEEVVGVAFQFTGRKCIVTKMPEQGALELADMLEQSERNMPGVNGPPSVAHAFAARYAASCGLSCEDGTPQGIYSLEQLIPPRPTRGSFIVARPEHVSIAAEFELGFQRDVHLIDPLGDVVENAKRRIQAGKLYFWVDEANQPVSVVLRARESAETATITFVYTPPEHRGKGYASNCVASLCHLLLGEGKRYCTLYADLSNPTSTGIYQAIGFRQVGEAAEVLFGDEGDA